MSPALVAAAPAAVLALVGLVVGGAVVGLAVAAMLRVSAGSHARLRYLMVLGALAASAGAAIPDRSPAARRAPAATLERVPAGGAAAPVGGAAFAEVPGSREVVDAIRGGWETAVSDLAAGPAAPWIVLVWAAGAGALVLYELLGHLHLSRARRRWTPATDELRRATGWDGRVPLYADPSEGPCTVGLARPVVVLPAWLVGRVDAVTLARIARHELAHARWRDPLANALLRLLRAAWWPCPHVWYLVHAARVEQEAAADHDATRDGESAVRVEYAAALVDVVAWSSTGTPARRLPRASAGAFALLETRIRRLVEAAPARPRRGLACGLVVLAAGVCSAFALPPARRAAPASEDTIPHQPVSAPADHPPANAAPAAAGRDAAPPAPPPRAGVDPRRAMRFVNLAEVPLAIERATAGERVGADGTRLVDPEVVLANRSGERITSLWVAFVRDGRVTAVLQDTTSIPPGGRYALRLPRLPGRGREFDGSIRGSLATMVATVLAVDLASGVRLGRPTEPGRLPPTPPELLADPPAPPSDRGR